MTTEQQIPKLLGSLVEHQLAFAELPTDDTQWAIMNTKSAIALCVEAIKNRKKEASVPETLLKFLGTITITVPAGRFVARDHFKLLKDGGICSYIGDNFKKWFLGKTEEQAGGESVLRVHELIKNWVDGPIIDEFGGKIKAETTLAEMSAWMKNGEHQGVRIFHIEDVDGILRAVDVHWVDDGWCVNAGSVAYLDRWGAGDLFLSR